ncbi:MAG: glycosyltransferase [Verrucomicrobiota bacterium]
MTLPSHPLIPTRAYANLPFVNHVENQWHAKKIMHVVRQTNAKSAILVNFVYYFPEIMRYSLFNARVYVCFDEFPKMWRRRSRGNWLRHAYQSRLMQARENRVASTADFCLTPHSGLKRKLETHARDVRMFFHAHEFNTLWRPEATKGAEHTRKNTKCINVAYMGFIHYRLLDQWLLRILDEPDMQLNLIGPVNSHYDISIFSEHPNFVLHAPVSDEPLARLLSSMDVLVMPYDPAIPEVEVLTSTSKLFQYIAVGKPIISSDLPNLMDFPEGVLVKATSPSDFIEKIRLAYEEDCEEYRVLRRGIASENTWDKRGEQLHGYLNELLGDRFFQP